MPATGHGNTPAAWTAISIMFVGVFVGAFGVLIATIWVLLLGLGIIALGAAVGGVMSMMGLGQSDGVRAGSRENKVAS